VTATGPAAMLPVAACMAAGLPIVSTVTPTVAELLEDRHTALMVAEPKPRLLVEKVLALREDAQLRRTIGDTARSEAYEFFPLTKFADRWRSVYRQVVEGRKVELQE
jgi:glycosyltransferase involved in cell wall biosynthesis